MKLKSIEYSEYVGQSNEWRLEGCTFGDANLIVGRNATGKTRTLNVIFNLCKAITGDKKLGEGNIRASFDDDGVEIIYIINHHEGKIVEEKLTKGDALLLERKSDGTGLIHAEELGQSIKFHPPQDESVAVTRRDAIQHPFLDELYHWGDSIIYFQFGKSMGQDQNYIGGAVSLEQDLNLKGSNLIGPVFKDGKDRYGTEYINTILSDMATIGYALEDTDIQPIGELIQNDQPWKIYGVKVKEKDLRFPTSHHEMSQGMFRALSLFIQLNYALLAKLPSCIIIDDIGEGLDYSRSTALIKLLIEKTHNTEMQLIMATNDRFVMNAVPLQYWSVIERYSHGSRIYNYRNSKEIFDEFEFTGLNNFDFFSSNYFLKKEKAQ